MDNKKQDNILILNFGETKRPVFKETRGKDWILMDDDDDYPSYLLWLYKSSSKHRAIVGGKAGYIYGKGLKAKVEGPKEEAFLKSVNRYGQKFNDLIKKSILDSEVFFGFYWQIIPSYVGFEIFRLTWKHVRKDKLDRGYWYKKDGKWMDKKEPAVFFPTFHPGIRVPSIFAYYEYSADMIEYPEPEYTSAINYIESDIVVSENTLSNAKGGFSASKFINFFNGEPSLEMKAEIEKKFTKKFTGPGGRKIIIAFNDSNVTKPTIDDLGTSDLTKEDFARVDKQIEQNIFTAHRVTSPMLFGIKTEGQLGGRNEMREAYEIFKNTYVNEKQQNLEEVINFFASLRGLSEFSLMPVEPIGFEFSESTIVQVAPRKYITDKIGIDPQEYPEVSQPAPVKPGMVAPTLNADVNSVLTNLTAKQHQQVMRIVREYNKGKLTRPAAIAMLKSGYGLSDDDITAFLGEEETQQFNAVNDDELFSAFESVGEPKSGYEIIKSKKVFFTSDKEMFEDELNQYQTNFESEVSDREAKILEIIKKDKRVTPEVVASVLKISVDEAKQSINALTEKGLIKTTVVKENGVDVEVKELEQPITEVTDKDQRLKILIRYSYEGPKDDRNRAFCAKMLELDRFYTRQNIETISEKLGYSVWDRRGGFWNDNGVVKPYCRHHWKSNVVLKKPNAA